jgi:hypothetical protein
VEELREIMTNDEILAHAEARANLQHGEPTETDFAAAETEIRQMLASGAIYSPETGWTH